MAEMEGAGASVVPEARQPLKPLASDCATTDALRYAMWYNAVMESFFSRMKDDRISRRRYRTRFEPRADIFDYIERFYNPKRRHSTLGGLSPVAYEKRAKQA